MKAVIVDDEAIARRYLRRILDAQPDIEVCAECEDVPTAAAAVAEHAPDVVFLDIQLRRASGFDLLGHLDRARLPFIVFVTAFDEHAVRAFEVHALDYVLKPFDAGRIGRALERARRAGAAGGRDERLAELIASLRAAVIPAGIDHLVVKSDGRSRFVRVADVEWIDAAHNNIVVHAAGQAHRMREPLSAIQARLDPLRFLRIHRSTIVNIDYVAELQSWFGGDQLVIMRHGQRLRVGRSYRDVFRRWTRG